jgi:hypothetical protein
VCYFLWLAKDKMTPVFVIAESEVAMRRDSITHALPSLLSLSDALSWVELG